ncbi:hypothetical protein LCGC14_2964760, partial [marine sediment metagenome]
MPLRASISLHFRNGEQHDPDQCRHRRHHKIFIRVHDDAGRPELPQGVVSALGRNHCRNLFEDTLLVPWIRNMSASRWPGRFVAKTVVPTSVIVRDEASANADPDDSSGIVPKGDGRIVVMLTCQYNEILGGAEKQCAALTAGLRSAGTNVEVVTSRVPGFDVPEHEPGVRRFWTYSPPQLAGRHLPAGIVWAVQVFVWIAINRRRIAILHCHQLRINAYVAALAHAAFGIPTVMKLGVGGERNDFTIINQRKYLFGRRGTRFVIRNSTKVIAIASQIRADCLAWGVPEARIESVVNGVDLSALNSNRLGWHSIRRTLFTELIDAGLNPLAARDFLRWKGTVGE